MLARALISGSFFLIAVYRTRTTGTGDEIYHPRQRRALSFDVVWSSDGGANVQLANDLPGWPCDTGYAWHHCNQRGWNTGFFKSSGDQTHGLMTYGSAGNQECSFHSISLQP